MTMATLIDTHCHLNYDYTPKSDEDLVREAGLAGVSHLVTIGTDIESMDRILAISEKFENVFHTVGVHPHEAVLFKDEDVARLTKAASHPKCRAIGEIGLDYHYEHSTPEIQQKVLKRQLDIALATRQPIVVHSREAEADLLPALQAYARALPTGALPGVIHCFTGTREFGQACVDIGFFISFSGILTFKKAEDLRECAQQFPLSQLLVETDSPYLAPIPYRGKKCEPSMVRLTAQKLAEIKRVSIDEIALQTTANAKRLFRI